ncbi:hypothetical protein B0H13DRAFT_2353166 [Mycena leptocephala]|nr:hypothetical protein B0H13DRAFT_2353166 [Mycena leptocephala]
MFIFVEGPAATSVTYSSTPHSVLSASFHARLPIHRRTPHLLITTATGTYHAISFPLAFTVSPYASSDVELGLDWVAFLRDSLIGLGYRVDSTFDAWRFLTMSTHPLSTPSSAENMPQVSSRSHLGAVLHLAGRNGAGSSIPRPSRSGNVVSLNSENNSETLNYADPVSKTPVPAPTFIPYTPLPSKAPVFIPYSPLPSTSSLHVHVPIHATSSDDILETLLLSPILSRNIFTAEASELVKIVKSHLVSPYSCHRHVDC